MEEAMERYLAVLDSEQVISCKLCGRVTQAGCRHVMEKAAVLDSEQNKQTFASQAEFDIVADDSGESLEAGIAQIKKELKRLEAIAKAIRRDYPGARTRIPGKGSRGTREGGGGG